ncbi:MAG: galactokinase family protein [Armatimonadota bacterium]
MTFTTKPLPPAELIRILESGSPEVDRYLGGEIYANADPAYLAAQRKRLAETVRFHAERVGERPTYLLRAPGRLNAFLEYLDMCAGDHMSTTIDGDIPVAVSPRTDDLLSVANINPLFPAEDLSISAEFERFTSEPVDPDNWDNRTKMLPYHGRAKGNWLNYVLAPYLRAAWDGADLSGADISFGRATAPFRAGTSSSSAIVVLAFLAMYATNRAKFPNWEVTEICSLLGEAEWYVGTHGGANDQTTILRNPVNGVLYNRHSHAKLDSTTLPFLRGVHVVLANSLWEVNKSLTGNQSFNMRKAWMEIGDAVLRRNIAACLAAVGEADGPGWVRRTLGAGFVPDLPILESQPKLWEQIAERYNKFGSLDSTILGIPDEAIDELILTLPVKLTVAEAVETLGIDKETLFRRYTKPRRNIGGYHCRTTARFFHTENIIGRRLEQIFLEADSRVRSGELSPDSPEYDEYRPKVGGMVDDLQHTLCYDFRVSTGQLDRLLSIARRGPGYLGGKLTGAGKGGCVSILVREADSEAMCRYLDREYYGNPANFEEYRQILEDALRYFEDDEYERNSAAERLRNLENALANIEEQRRVATFSRGACALDLPTT